MNIEQIILHPITTPEFSDPDESRRFIHDDSFNGYEFLAFIADDLAERREEIAALHTLEVRLRTIAWRGGPFA